MEVLRIVNYKYHGWSGVNVEGGLLEEIQECLSNTECPQKLSEEASKYGDPIYCPKAINKNFRDLMLKKGWKKDVLLDEDAPLKWKVDFVKKNVGVEIQLGKYAFLSHDYLKLQAYVQRKKISIPIIIMPSKYMQSEMSTGVGCYGDLEHMLEYLEWDLRMLLISVEPAKAA